MLCDQLHRVADFPLVPSDLLTMQRYEIYRALPNFDLRIDGFLPSKLLKFVRIDASIILLSSNRNIGPIFCTNSLNLHNRVST